MSDKVMHPSNRSGGGVPKHTSEYKKVEGPKSTQYGSATKNGKKAKG